MLTSVAYCQQYFRIPSQGAAGLREYFPGDIVHIVIEAPLDTAYVRAVMPDGEPVNLNYDGRSNMWHGYWEVPAGFKKGLYHARLAAADLEGNVFEGESGNFYISEPALALMMRLPTKEEIKKGQTASSREAEARERALESARLAREAERKKAMEERVTEEYVPAAPTEEVPAAQPEMKATIERPAPAEKLAARPKFKAAKKAKKKTAAAAKEDVNVTKVRLMVSAKDYLNRMEYEKAEIEIRRLLQIEPENRGVRQIYNRLQAVIKARSVQPQ